MAEQGNGGDPVQGGGGSGVEIYVLEGDEITEVLGIVAEKLFGSDLEERRVRGFCINCNEPGLEKCYSEAGRREFHISGLCEKCFDTMFPDE